MTARPPTFALPPAGAASAAPQNASGTPPAQTVCALLTCHNRAATTLECLQGLHQQRLPPGMRLAVVLVDDGSTDGTAQRVQALHPGVEVLCGDGNLYWNGGMRRAFAHAMAAGHEFYLWLNDDTRLYPDALLRLLEQASQTAGAGQAPAIVVGSLRDPVTGLTSYSGWKSQSRRQPADCVKMTPGSVALACDTFNGNCVLIPRAAAERVGNLDPRFTHAMGDMDYGFRATRAGCTNWVLPGHVGECQQNTGVGLWTDKSLPWRDRYGKMMGPKGLPPRQWWAFTSRHSGPLWPLYWAAPYLKMFWSGAREALGHRECSSGH